ncbi:MAG: tRNA (N(6)-L-threonylcarbamoyladenosine(37)-C(2))-methylthiotransferase MtaB [Candidatus Omnitrophica bacterium]|nr:tRNA (N(6)-L-threonylcarbamoyladenosine(37)-C(2))-methylthiotransferase MtaB [Candidatus Omnitrophota bacterium]
MKVAFKTLGCKVNQYETELMRERLLGAGFEEASPGVPADIYIINTCTVTQKTDSESRRLIRLARRQNPASRVIVTGCYAELDSDEIEKVAGGLTIVKNSEKSGILGYLRRDTGQAPSHTISGFTGRTKAFIKVQDGCDNFCSYCKVPLVRGRSRSRAAGEVLTEIGKIVSNGYKEIILTGICLGDWGRGAGMDLSRLLNEIEDNIRGDYRLRLSSIEPWYVSDGLIKKIASSKKICRHLHIPMQSGDDSVLKRMDRTFNPADFAGLIERFRAVVPEAAFTTDIVVGFPGEGEKEFENTLRLVELTKPSRTHIFPFSRRKGTRAYEFTDTVGAGIVRERVKRLKQAGERLAHEYERQFAGRPVQVLVETRRDKRTGLLTGYTDTYIKTAFSGPDDLKGTLKTVRLAT